MSENISRNPFEDAFAEMTGDLFPSIPAPTTSVVATPTPVPQNEAAPKPIITEPPVVATPNPALAPQPTQQNMPTLLDLGSEDDAPDELANFAEEIAENNNEAPNLVAAPKPAIVAVPEPASTVADESEGEIENPLTAAIEKLETNSVYAALPVFEYSSATETIEDLTQTFDAFRLSKVADFPELEDGNRVTWTVTYGKISKTILPAEAKKIKIGECKTDIEVSKAFRDALKKAKDKNPCCVIKPSVRAQSKGKVISPYKGVYADISEATQSGKLISIVPGRDGNVYEIRETELGTFTTPISDCADLSEVRAGFVPALPLVPWERLYEIIGFFREQLREDGNYEALANLLWDKETETFVTYIPQQVVTRGTVVSDLSDMPDFDRYLHYMDIHSHNTMPAKFSVIDDADEKATRVYAVIGRLDNFMPDISVRISNGGKYLPIEPNVVFETFDSSCPDEWTTRITVITPEEVLCREI